MVRGVIAGLVRPPPQFLSIEQVDCLRQIQIQIPLKAGSLRRSDLHAVRRALCRRSAGVSTQAELDLTLNFTLNTEIFF